MLNMKLVTLFISLINYLLIRYIMRVKKLKKSIGFRVSDNDFSLLEKLLHNTGNTKTEIFRQFLQKEILSSSNILKTQKI